MTPRPLAEEVLAAALARADALATGDRDRLARLLHPDFRWTSHTGESFDRAAYLRANTRGPDGSAPSTSWSGQRLEDVEVVGEGDTAVLRCVVVDRVDQGEGPEDFAMPMTQTWVRRDGAGTATETHAWVLLAGHAGPRLPHDPSGITAASNTSSQE